MRILVFLFILGPCFGQHLAIGVKAGARPTSQFEGYGVPESRPYLVGPMIEVSLPHGFGVEFDALYSRFGYTSSAGDIFGGAYFSRARANQWQFPILLKRRLPIPLVKPYALVGYAPLYTNGTVINSGVQVDYYGTRTVIPPTSYSADYGFDHGLVAGGGVEFGGSHVRFAPEIRYIRWKSPLFSESGSHGYYIQAPQNEVQLLLGIAWR